MRPCFDTTNIRSTAVSGTFPLVNNTNEQDVVVLTLTKRIALFGVLLDAVNLTQDGTVRLYNKIDGTNYRCIYEALRSDAADPDGIWIPAALGVNTDTKVTYQSTIVEGAARNILYRIVYANMER